ncbi:unnamed protein product [Prorocentrum cordatum]|uniref:H(+)-exporting diphosphatase n=1 Tax=Prorocentrum cordatum TaxID=2364126 RepID=A0ABN9PG81_9DINO|nr:unnamed protein product [Polarella glacialis]
MSLAYIVSTASLVLAVLFVIGGVQSGGAIFDTCNQGVLAISAISYDQCREMGNSIAAMGASHATFLSGLLVIARAEATLFLGMGWEPELSTRLLSFTRARRRWQSCISSTQCGPSPCASYTHAALEYCLIRPLTPMSTLFSTPRICFFIVPLTGSFGAVFCTAFFLLLLCRQPPERAEGHVNRRLCVDATDAG